MFPWCVSSPDHCPPARVECASLLATVQPGQHAIRREHRHTHKQLARLPFGSAHTGQTMRLCCTHPHRHPAVRLPHTRSSDCAQRGQPNRNAREGSVLFFCLLNLNLKDQHPTVLPYRATMRTTLLRHPAVPTSCATLQWHPAPCYPAEPPCCAALPGHPTVPPCSATLLRLPTVPPYRATLLNHPATPLCCATLPRHHADNPAAPPCGATTLLCLPAVPPYRMPPC